MLHGSARSSADTCLHLSFSNLFKYLPLKDATAKAAFMMCGPSGWLLVICLVVYYLKKKHLLERMDDDFTSVPCLDHWQPPTSDDVQ